MMTIDSGIIIVGILFLIIILVALIVVLCLMLGKKNRVIADLEYKNTHDTITGHMNWNAMFSAIDLKTVEKSLPYDFVHFDIKDFKYFNEIYNHDVGDAVLRFVSAKILEQDFILYSARCHNDNFAFITKQDFKGDLYKTLEEMFDSMKYMPGLEEIPIYYRCGVVERNKLLREQDTVADMAKMAQSKGQKANCSEVIFYDDEMKNMIIRGAKLKMELPEAIMRDEILVYLQPKFDATTEKIAGAEALVRWMYHGTTLMFPGDFVPHLERNNAINMLDEHVLEKVCQYLENWSKAGKPLYPISVNLSQKELYKNNLVESLINIVNKYDIGREYIDFEITESAFYDDKEYMMMILREIKEAGFSLSMDDFGTGYSSFSMLKDMPLNTLKIDKSFVDSIGKAGEEKGVKIVQDIVGMVKDLSIRCVAEGVEVESQKEALKNWGCDYIQGYYYSKPIPVSEYEENYL